MRDIFPRVFVKGAGGGGANLIRGNWVEKEHRIFGRRLEYLRTFLDVFLYVGRGVCVCTLDYWSTFRFTDNGCRLAGVSCY